LALMAKQFRHFEYGNLLLTNSLFYHFRFIFNEKSGQEFVNFSSAWPSKMIDKTKVKDLKFKMKFYLNRKRQKKQNQRKKQKKLDQLLPSK
jgi:hypothetical protein